ncbi:DEAD box helicase [Cordyceps javanica]|uniref:DEAD box helicase n=1 Tax=Cordyceps javanica TaxID=43265 RepID=A0A545VLB9_9HYPO|nr:DEAD box helicase [Cordyceps javanica]TQW02456.1 DEAD box helicase [Cordyceps javanica]
MPEGDLTYIYTDVQVQGAILAAHGAAIRVSFSTGRTADTPVDWATSNRLRQGSLVVLSPVGDSFNSKCYVATIAYRFLAGGLWPDLDSDPPEPDNTPPRVDLYFPTWHEELLDLNTKYYMLEAKDGYFESFRHTMTALQTAASERCVVDKYVLAANAKDVSTEKHAIRPPTRHTLDKSQVAASAAILSQELSITQGPPGTGKTYTTVVTIDEFIRRGGSTKPVIVAAQTNHAVDQLLERCLHRNLACCRLGGRTVSETVKEHSLFNWREKKKGVVDGIRLPAAAYQDFETARQVLELCLKKAFHGQRNYDARSFKDFKIITTQQLDSLQNDEWETSAETDPLLAWLGWQSFETLSAPKAKLSDTWMPKVRGKIRGEDADAEDQRRAPDPDKPIGPFIQFRRLLDHPAARFKAMLARNRDLYKIKVQHREELFRYMCHELSKKSQQSLEELFNKFQAACRRLQKSKIDRDNRVIGRTDIQIVGCTITGLSKYRELLCKIGPDILIIDEASEATEGSIAAALLPSLKHLALVGDHQQLTPRPITRILTEPIFALNVSLFERLVTRNNMPCQVLNMQRRMIPEIRQLVNVFYPGLADHSSVAKRDKIKGLKTPLWWYDHSWPERTDSGTSSHSISNDGEADMIAEFAKYLFRCGTPVSNLTVLTFYTAQQELIEGKLGVHNPNICKTVDSFQGCENDVIILSVVRSSRPGQRPRVGFVENIHRATVALSRARNAFYIFGNASNLKGSDTWDPVIKALGPLKQSFLPLVCPLHHTTTFVRCLQDWSSISGETGCHGKTCEGDCSQGTKLSDAQEDISRWKQHPRDKFASTAAAVQLSRTTLDQLDSTSSYRLTSLTCNTSLAAVCRDKSSHRSDCIKEIIFDTFIAELEELAAKAREEMLNEKLVDLGDAGISGGDLIEFD